MKVQEITIILWYIAGTIAFISGFFTDDILLIIAGILSHCLANLMEINFKLKSKK